MEAVEIFSGANCAGTPDVLAVYNENACSDISFGNDTYYISRSCNISDRFAHTEQVFGDFTYVIMETYDNKSCTSFGEADTFLASGSCEISSGLGDQSAITILFPNGSAVVSLYPNKACGGEPSLHFELSKTALSTGALDSHLDDGQRGSQKPLSLVRLWDDEVIATARISREKIVIQRHLCRGGGGEVYYGLFNQQQVAIKMLLPDMRKSVKHVNAFLAEVKLMATLDHPRIVQFVGVAWDSLTDLCVVSEFMEGGDLWGLLTRYQNENHPTGFDRTKVTIALHVAHALTYLHSLETPVLHRDLKSKNVLLTSSLEAKLTDFGISREQADRTMTAGVGTSLWMAPEVMLGETVSDSATVWPPTLGSCITIKSVRSFRPAQAVTMEAVEIFSRVNCAGTPDVFAMYNVSASCAVDACSDISFGNDTYFISRACNISDRFAHTQQVFGDFTYVIMETYDNNSCSSFGEADVFLASGSCEISSGFGDQSAITSLFSNGSGSVTLYPNNACGGEPSLLFELDSVALSTAAALVAVLAVALFILRRVRTKREAEVDENDAFNEFQSPHNGHKSGSLTAHGSLETASVHGHSESSKPLGLVGLWDDEVIATARIPREKVIVLQPISRGGGGEVYKGLFNQQQVAIKMLLPEMRKSVKHVNAFLTEVKLMATLDHPRIVQFVGVAWDSLTDFCVVSEFMEGGDLRGLLTRYQNENHPSVLHRDLKSKNVLLTSSLEAKLTDFGISREQADRTMTAGVGTSLWMAPEVMLGRDVLAMYNVSASCAVDACSDISFGNDTYFISRACNVSDRFAPTQQVFGDFTVGKLRDRVSIGAIVGIAAAALVAVLAVALFILRRVRTKREAEVDKNDAFNEFQSPHNGHKSGSLTAHGSLETASVHGHSESSNLSVFRDQDAAAEMRKSVKHVNAFLTEVKLMATLDNSRIVQFVGVAWDSLTDFCVVSEFMEGGDLWGLLTRYQNENHPTGFDRTKVTIALHVAHALTYLHSLETPVLHRDLKSKNVLLTSSLEAKLTDFGISENKPIEP
ncbi:hypothetical protein PInf_014416 [Phytophthora infestans]|nr:hypothetical protein PInf_014416 [Phytophthora infestans]